MLFWPYLAGRNINMNPAQTITLYQPLLQTIAYNLVRCKEDAEDIVQETFLKYLSIDQQSIQNTKAYLIKAVTNNCLNHLAAIRRKKEECIDKISESIRHFKEINLSHLDLEIDLTKALAVVQAKLEPVERAVYLLKEVFDVDYDTLQVALDKKKDHCRQLLSRAKKKLAENTPRISLPDTSKLMESFRHACDQDNVTDFITELKKSISGPEIN